MPFREIRGVPARTRGRDTGIKFANGELIGRNPVGVNPAFRVGELICDKSAKEIMLYECKYATSPLSEDKSLVLKVMARNVDWEPEFAAAKVLTPAKIAAWASEARCVNVPVPIYYAFGEDLDHKAIHFIVMERMWKDLWTLAETYQPFSVHTTCSVAFNVLRGLCFLHQHDLAHGDVKPDNIMVAEGDRSLVKLIDFDFVHSISEQKRAVDMHRRLYLEAAKDKHADKDELAELKRDIHYSAPCYGDTDCDFASHCIATGRFTFGMGDVEGLAYTLLWMVDSGALPWTHAKPEEARKMKWGFLKRGSGKARWAPIDEFATMIAKWYVDHEDDGERVPIPMDDLLETVQKGLDPHGRYEWLAKREREQGAVTRSKSNKKMHLASTSGRRK